MIDLSNAARDIVEIIEATEEKERKRAAEILLKHIVPPENDGYWFNDVLRDLARQIID